MSKVIQKKVVIVGDACVGKSNILLRYCRNLFTDKVMPTIGVSYENKKIQKKGKTIELCIWDTEGQERFRTITSSFYRDVDFVIIVYDICNRNTFDSLPSWIDSIFSSAPEGAEIILLGNKSDDIANRQVPLLEAEEFALEYGLQLMEVSAKEDINIDEAFDLILEICDPTVRPKVERANTFPSPKKSKKISLIRRVIRIRGFH